MWPWVLKCYTACQRPTLLPTTTMVSDYFIKVPRAPADLLLVGKELSQSWQHWADMILLGLGPTWAMAGKGAAPTPFSGTEAGCWRLTQGATQGGFVLPPGEDPGLHNVCPSGEGMRPFWSTHWSCSISEGINTFSWIQEEIYLNWAIVAQLSSRKMWKKMFSYQSTGKKWVWSET